MTIDGKKEPKRKTEFKIYLSNNNPVLTDLQPTAYQNVLFVRHSNDYGDLFIAWDDNENEFATYFGTKGDEFND